MREPAGRVWRAQCPVPHREGGEQQAGGREKQTGGEGISPPRSYYAPAFLLTCRIHNRLDLHFACSRCITLHTLIPVLTTVQDIELAHPWSTTMYRSSVPEPHT